MTVGQLPIGTRVVILGCPGSGKSTFARSLHERTGLPLIHLDNIWWRADRTHISRDEFDQRLAELLSSDRWIIEGDYSRTYDVRVRSCETVIFLDYPEDVCMDSLRERVGKQRTDIPWVEDQLDPELVKIVRNYRGKNRPAIFALLEKYPDKQALIFKTRVEANRWLSQP